MIWSRWSEGRREGQPDSSDGRAAILREVARVYRFALRLAGPRNGPLAEDIAQETFLRAWRHRRSLRDASAARAWLFRIARNVWRDHLRRTKGAPALELLEADAAGGPPRGETPPESVLEAREEADLAPRELASLPPRPRQVLYLHSIEGLSHAEISSVLWITPGAVKASLSHARLALRRRLGRLLPRE